MGTQEKPGTSHSHPSWPPDNRRPWVLGAAWFGTIALVGVLRKVLEKQASS